MNFKFYLSLIKLRLKSLHVVIGCGIGSAGPENLAVQRNDYLRGLQGHSDHCINRK